MNNYEHVRRRLIEAAGHSTQSMGVGRVLGQIFAFLYLSPAPRTLDDITGGLGISKGSASMGVRQLEQWGGVEKVWVKGDRKDYYQAHDTFGRLIKNALADLAGKRIQTSAALLKDVEVELQDQANNGKKPTREERFMLERVEHIREFQNKAETLWDSVILKMLLD